MDDFATKLVNGTLKNVSPRMSWWPRHVCVMDAYVATARAGKSLGKIKEMASKSCVEWELGLPSVARARLMEGHVALEMSLVEAVLRDDGAKVVKLGELLSENAQRQAEVLDEAIATFPKNLYHSLLAEHLLVFCSGLKNRLGRADCGVAKASGNVIRLAMFTAEWI